MKHRWTKGAAALLAFAMTLGTMLMVTTPVMGRPFGRTVQAEHEAVFLVVDGNDVSTDTLFYDGKTYIPVRDVAKITGQNISWNGQSRVVHLHHDPLEPEYVLPEVKTVPVWEREPYPLGRRVVTGNTKVPVLMYHHVDDQWQSAPSVIISKARFEEHIVALKNAGYEGIFFEDLLRAAYGEITLPAKPVIVTFDDGYMSNYTCAFPVLQKHNFKANINVVGASRGRTPGSIPHFTWEQAREMVESGLVEIGDHTWDLHGEGVVMSAREAVDAFVRRIHNDIGRNMRTIEGEIGVKPVVFCYPYGRNDRITRNTVEELGYFYQLTVRDGVITSSTDRTAIPRITARGDMTGQTLIQRIARY